MTSERMTTSLPEGRVENNEANVQLREVTPDDETFLYAVYASSRDEELAGLGWDEKQKDAFIRMQYVIREKSFPRVEDRIVVLDGHSIGRLTVDRTKEA